MTVQSLLSGLLSIIIVFLILSSAFVALVWIGFFPTYLEAFDQLMDDLLGNNTNTSSWPADQKKQKKKKPGKRKTKQRPGNKQPGRTSPSSSWSTSRTAEQGDSSAIQDIGQASEYYDANAAGMAYLEHATILEGHREDAGQETAQAFAEAFDRDNDGDLDVDTDSDGDGDGDGGE